jgi:hypothetical protein
VIRCDTVRLNVALEKQTRESGVSTCHLMRLEPRIHPHRRLSWGSAAGDLLMLKSLDGPMGLSETGLNLSARHAGSYEVEGRLLERLAPGLC